ncbi:MAG: hypothetical protein ACTSXQ_00375 [Alphaproteobacteria bacterium]
MTMLKDLIDTCECLPSLSNLIEVWNLLNSNIISGIIAGLLSVLAGALIVFLTDRFREERKNKTQQKCKIDALQVFLLNAFNYFAALKTKQLELNSLLKKGNLKDSLKIASTFQVFLIEKIPSDLVNFFANQKDPDIYLLIVEMNMLLDVEERHASTYKEFFLDLLENDTSDETIKAIFQGRNKASLRNLNDMISIIHYHFSRKIPEYVQKHKIVPTISPLTPTKSAQEKIIPKQDTTNINDRYGLDNDK